MPGVPESHLTAADSTDRMQQILRLEHGAAVITLISSCLPAAFRTDPRDKPVCQKALAFFAICLRRLLLIDQITLIQARMKRPDKLFVSVI